MMRPWSRRRSIREALDNLPTGLCFFDEDGFPVLCNRRMYRLVCELTGRDLQQLAELEPWLTGELCTLPDGSAWQFGRREIRDEAGRLYTEVMASDVTELFLRKQELEEGIRQKQEMLASLEHISRNTAIITRNEEALRLKMAIHNDLGAALSFARRYLAEGCPPEGKEDFLARQRDMSRILLQESGSREDNDPLGDLYAVAEGLGMRIETEGGEGLDMELRRIISYAVRECLTNTVKHAGGDTVYLRITEQGSWIRGELANNGRPPEGEIREGGGLSSLREKLRRCGGTMQVISRPRFRLIVELPGDAVDN